MFTLVEIKDDCPVGWFTVSNLPALQLRLLESGIDVDRVSEAVEALWKGVDQRSGAKLLARGIWLLHPA